MVVRVHGRRWGRELSDACRPLPWPSNGAISIPRSQTLPEKPRQTHPGWSDPSRLSSWPSRDGVHANHPADHTPHHTQTENELYVVVARCCLRSRTTSWDRILGQTATQQHVSGRIRPLLAWREMTKDETIESSGYRDRSNRRLPDNRHFSVSMDHPDRSVSLKPTS